MNLNTTHLAAGKISVVVILFKTQIVLHQRRRYLLPCCPDLVTHKRFVAVTSQQRSIEDCIPGVTDSVNLQHWY